MTENRSSAFPSLGFLGRFGRSADLRALDKALREVDLHPNLMPEAVKLTLVKLLREACPARPETHDYEEAAALAAYCMIGPDAFSAVNNPVLARQQERRIEAALEEEGSLDGQIILLTLHAKLVHPAVIETFQLSSEET